MSSATPEERLDRRPVPVAPPREAEVLRLVARRLTDKEIAAALALSPRTVMHRVSSLLGKLGLAARREAAVWAARHDLG